MLTLVIAWIVGLIIGFGIERYQNPQLNLKTVLWGSAVSLAIGIFVSYIEYRAGVNGKYTIGVVLIVVNATAAFLSTWGLAYLGRKKNPPTPTSKNGPGY